MAYYNRNYEKFNLKKEEMSYLNHGGNANVFRHENIIFKEYFSTTLSRFRLDPKIFDILKDIKNNHLIELYDLYSDMNLLELLQYKMNIRPFEVDGYTAKYYADNSLNVLYESIDYIIDNFRELDKLFETFTNRSIRADDVKRDNTILDSNGIVIIDPDCFIISMDSKRDLAIDNKRRLLSLFKSICITCIDINELCYSNVLSKIDGELVDIEVTENTDIAYVLSKKLKPYKKPIDYFIKQK